MRKTATASILLLLIVSFTLSFLSIPVIAQESLSIGIAEQYLHRTERVYITVNSSYTDNITVEIYTPAETLWLNETDWQANETRDYRIPSFAPFGNYTVKAKIPMQEAYSWFMVSEPLETLELSCNQDFYYLKGEPMQINATSNNASSVTLSLYWNWKNFSENELVYQNTKTANATWNLPTENQKVGFYKIVANTTETIVTIWRTLLHTTNYVPESLPFSYVWKGINYTLEDRTLTATTDDDFLNITYPKIPWKHRTRFYRNNMTFVIRLDNQSQGWAVDWTYATIHSGLKWIINGTLDNPVTFDFKLNHNPFVAWKKRLDSFRSTSNLVLDWSDIRKAKKAFTWNATTKTLHVEIPSSFSIDPEIFSDGFESGDFTAWTSTAGSPAVTSGDAKEGTYKAVFDADGERCVYDDASYYNDVYFRCYFRISAMPDSSTDEVLLGAIARMGSYATMRIYLYHDGTDVVWRIRYKYDGSFAFVNSAQQKNPSVDTYYCVEIRSKVGTTDAEYQVWIDGTELTDIHQTGLKQEYGTDGIIGGTHILTGFSATLYLDSCIMDEAYIGEISEEDTTAPTYSDVGTNTTKAGMTCKFYTKWTDETGLATTGGFIFGTNNTGTWTNETWSAFSSNPDWSNVTKTLNSSTNYVVQWRIWANDTSDNWNNTGIQSLTTTITLAWTNGFEEGDFSSWSGTWTNGATAEVTSSLSHQGSYSANFSGLQSLNEYAVVYKEFGVGYSDIYGRAYVNTSHVPSNTDMEIGVFFSGDGWDTDLAISVYNGSSSKWGVWIYNTTGWWTSWESGTSTFNNNTWYCVELRVYVHDTNGIITLWVNGNEKLNKSSIDTNDRGDVQTFGTGCKTIYSASFDAEVEMLSDSVEIDTSYIGLFLQEYTLTFEEILNVVSDSYVWRSIMFLRSETISVVSSFYSWGAYHFFVTELMNIVSVDVIQRSLLRSFTESLVGSSVEYVFRSLFRSFSEAINIAESHDVWRELLVLFLNFFEEINVESAENIWRALYLSFSESSIVTEAHDILRALLFIGEEESVISAITNVWRAITFTVSETMNLSEVHSFLSERLLVSVEFFESIILSSQAFFVGIVPIVEIVLPIIDMIIVFVTAWFFTIGHIFQSKKTLIYGIIAFVAWWIVGFLWLFIQPLSPMVAMLFFAIGIIILVTVLIGMLSNLKLERMRGRQLD